MRSRPWTFLVFTVSPALVSTCSMCWMTRPATEVAHTTTTSSRYAKTLARFVIPVPPHALVRGIRRDTGASERHPCGVPAAVGILVQVPSCSRTQLHVSFWETCLDRLGELWCEFLERFEDVISPQRPERVRSNDSVVNCVLHCFVHRFDWRLSPNRGSTASLRYPLGFAAMR